MPVCNCGLLKVKSRAGTDRSPEVFLDNYYEENQRHGFRIIKDMHTKLFGVLFVATGGKCLEEAVRSVISLKKCMANVPATLWTDEDADVQPDLFDQVQYLDRPTSTYMDKIAPLSQTPYEKTIFVDSDTYFLESVHEVFDLLSHFELAYAHSPVRVSPWCGNESLNVPICFPEANTGVLAYRLTESVARLFAQWLEIYSCQLLGTIPPNHDQPAFRKALYNSEVRATVLPPEYNFRTIVPGAKGRGKVKILHGRDPSLSRAISAVNKSEKISAFDFR